MKNAMTKILVIGEICTDVFVYCDTKRLSPEAPVPVLTPHEVKKNDGMAGNVVQNISAISTNSVVYKLVQPQHITKTRYIDKKTNHMFIRVDDGEDKVSRFEMTYVDKEQIKQMDIVIVSDYDKGFLDLALLKEIGELSKLSILDSKRKLTEEVINSFTFVKLNKSEASNNKHLAELSNVIITLGDEGCSFSGITYPSPKPQETIDVSGAGDTFTASFILKYYETQDIESSLKYANEMSSVVVSKRGVATP
jgi:D-beta-D-heptose 7-phosphate kinase/D-beta-D-heptose 1-phosphate adenosyltransferase